MFKIIISPAKKMKYDEDFKPLSKPLLLTKANKLYNYLKGLDKEKLKKIYKTNDKITLEQFNLLRIQDIKRANNSALFTYDGIQYHYLAANIMQEDELAYLNKHLFILSGLYGILRPFDSILLYRLEMQSKLLDFEYTNLYDYWKDAIEKIINDQKITLIINLASKEYSDVIPKNINAKMLNIYFKEYDKTQTKLKEKAVYTKMARGAMLRYMAINKIEDIEKIKGFNDLNYSFDQTLSDQYNYYFIRRK